MNFFIVFFLCKEKRYDMSNPNEGVVTQMQFCISISKSRKENHMEYQVFLEEIKERAAAYLGSQYKVDLNYIPKNNGIILDGLTITREGESVSPTIYLEPFYEWFKEGQKLQDILAAIMHTYEHARLKEGINMDFFADFSKVANHIVYKLINYERNAEQLDGIPYFRYLDLAIVFYYIYENNMIGSATIQITNHHLKMWHVTKEEIYELAKKNTPKLLKAECKNMQEILRELMYERGREVFSTQEAMHMELDKKTVDDMGSEGMPMYVLSNASRINGAAVILYKDALKGIAEKLHDNLYILPSSIHEVILVPQDYCNRKNLEEMVSEVNTSQVDAQEVLSNRVYLYSRKDETICVF